MREPAHDAGEFEQPMPNPQIDGRRLWDALMHTAKIGATPKGGICRLTLTDPDRQVRDWFKAQCEAAVPRPASFEAPRKARGVSG
jgi:hypothetical protein